VSDPSTIEHRAPDHPGLAGVASRVVALGRELDGLRRMQEIQRSRLGEIGNQGDELAVAVGPLAEELRRVDRLIEGLARAVAGIGEELAEHVQHLDEDEDEEERDKRLSWFEIEDTDIAVQRLVDLADWLERVYIRYPDGGLPSCWMWHPAVVEELLWLRRTWDEAFHGHTASALRAADWHDRQRPGVVRRIGELEYGTCTLSRHRRGEDQDAPPPRAPLGRGQDAETARLLVAAWWTGSRTDAAPTPTPEHLAAAGALW
jgi:hypothetical protein